MKDSEFIALLNLYLDHEITAADAARLEAEVQSNPERRRVYREYCQMQKACKVLAADFQTAPAATTPRKVIDFRAAQQRQQRTSMFYTVGALTAAAACMAIVVIGRNRQNETSVLSGATPVIAQTQPAAPGAAVQMAASQPRQAAHSEALLVNTPLTLSDHARAQALEAVAKDPVAAQFAWMQDFRLKPLHQSPASANLFEVRPAAAPTEPQTYNSPRPLDPNVTPMVIRFQK